MTTSPAPSTCPNLPPWFSVRRNFNVIDARSPIMNLSRRAFIKRGGLALVSIGAMPLWGPSFLQQLVFAAEPARALGGKKILICIFQRGAVDGLSMVVPYGDPYYYQSRSDIAIAQPTQNAGPQGVLDLNGFFGLHPGMA